MRKILKKLICGLFAMMYKRKSFYNFFYFLYTQGLKGIEQGSTHASMQDNGELKVIGLLKDISKKPIIFDGGANVGDYIQSCIKILGDDIKIYAFEPLSMNFNTLSKNFLDNKNIYLNQMALSNQNGTITINYNEKYPRLSSAVDCNFEHYGIFLDKREEVKATTIQSFCEQYHISKFNLLKLDLEGFDYFALKGAHNMILQQDIDLIQFEMGRPNVDSRTFFKDFYVLLKDNYDLYRILSFGFVKITEYSYEYEIFLGCNFLAVSKNLKLSL